MFVVTAEEMREMDRLTIHKHGIPSLTLMERAGESISAAILENFAAAAKKGVVIVAGKGNNGGDGFVVARLLKKTRIACEVVLLAKRTELSADAAHNCRAFEQLKGKVAEVKPDILGEVSYGQLQSGHIRVRNKKVPTASLSSYSRAVEIATILKEWILDSKFFLTEPVAPLPSVETGITFKPLKEHPIEE